MSHSIGTTHLTKNANWHRELRTCLAEAIPHHHEALWLVRSEINKLLDAQVLHTSHSSSSEPIFVVPKGNGGKCLVIDYRALNKVTPNFVWSMPRVEDIFAKLNGAEYFSTLTSMLVIITYPLMKTLFPKKLLHLLLENTNIWRFLLD